VKLIRKLLIKCSFIIFLSPLAGAQQNNGYLNALDRFQQNFQEQVFNIFWSKVHQQADKTTYKEIDLLKSELESFHGVFESRLTQMKVDYEAQFINNQNTSREEKERLRKSEIAVKWAAEIILNAMADLAFQMNSDKILSRNGLEKFRKKIADISIRLSDFKSINPTPLDELRQRLPAVPGRLKALCGIAAGICLNKPIQNLLKGIPFASIVKKGTSFDLTDVRPLQLPENSSVVLILNHDNTIADQKVMQLIAEKLGLNKNLLTTTLIAWPHTKLLPVSQYFFDREKEAVFIEDPLFSEKVQQRLASQESQIPSVTFFPEGDQAFWSSNFPIYIKAGGYIAARKAAIRGIEVGRKIFLVQATLNFWEQMTTELSTVKVSISTPELVPSSPISKSDAWVEMHRSDFEKTVNANRGHFQVELHNPSQIQGIWLSSQVGTLNCQKLLAH
jgi:hypothetical protein